MSDKKEKYDPHDKYNWGKGSFSVVLEPHETKGLTDQEILKLIDEREQAIEKARNVEDK